MKNNWASIKISKLVEKLTDYVSNGSFASLAENVVYQKDGYARLIRLLDYNNQFSEKDSVWVDKHGYDFLSKSKLFGGEIIISNVGEYAGTAFLAPKLTYPTTLAPNSIMLTTKGNDTFYYYYFKSPIGYRLIRNIVSSSGQPKFNKTNFKELIVPNPPIETQNKIATFLNSIDRKININSKINLELESMAKTLYDYWFLQFEFPNEEGKPYKSSGGKMVWNDELKREIPEGWKVKKIVNILNEADKSKVQVNEAKEKGGYPFFTSGNSILSYDEFFVDGFNIFLNTGGNPDIKAYMGKCAYSTDTWCISANEYSYVLYYYLLKLMPQFEQLFFAGSGLKHLQKNALKNKYILLPDPKLLKLFNVFCISNWKKSTNCYVQNQELSSLRDFLLPLLMNGQVTFKDESYE